MPLTGRVLLGGTAGALDSLVEEQAADTVALLASAGALFGSLVGF